MSEYAFYIVVIRLGRLLQLNKFYSFVGYSRAKYRTRVPVMIGSPDKL